jgi:hypothetical protein
MVRDAHGAEPEFTGNIATRYGEFNEDGAVSEYEMETGNRVEKVGFITAEVAQPGEVDQSGVGWAGCSPDGLINDDGGLEAKCPFGKRDKGDLLPLEDQPHYYDQVQFSLWVTGRKFWHFYQWTAHKSKLECILPDQAWRDENLPRLRQFHAEFLAEDPAPHLAAKRVEIDTLEAARVIAEYDQIVEAIENATARKAELLAEMVRQAGGKDAVYAGRNLTRIAKQGVVSYAKALARYAPNADLEPFRGKPSECWVIK